MLHKCLQWVLWIIVNNLRKTLKFEFRDLDKKNTIPQHFAPGSYVYAVWHEEVFSILAGFAYGVPHMAMASRSKDGDFAASIAGNWGYIMVRGSSRKKNKDKGGKEAVETYVENVQKGIPGGITIDGPKGPRHKCKPGIVVIAQRTGAPIVPIIATATSYWEFNSWDRFKIPKPFSRVVIQCGEPIYVEQELSFEQLQAQCERVESALHELRKNFSF